MHQVEFARGARGSSSVLHLEREGETVVCTVVREHSGPIAEEPREPIEMLREGVHYVDLRRASMEVIEQNLPALAEAECIVFDLRGYPDRKHAVLQHLATEPLEFPRFEVPQRIAPGPEGIRTIPGVRAGRDEYLDRALELFD